MYLKTENLQALVNGHELNLYQKSLAKKELERLLTLLKDTEEAITVTHCCKSDSELFYCQQQSSMKHNRCIAQCDSCASKQ